MYNRTEILKDAKDKLLDGYTVGVVVAYVKDKYDLNKILVEDIEEALWNNMFLNINGVF